MERVVNIHDIGHKINLRIGKYKIDVLGGWGIRMGQFSISLKNDQTGQIIDCERYFWPKRSFAFGKRATRIFMFHIIESGIYEIAFRHPSTLEVKETSLFVTRLFQEPSPNDKISVYIH